MSAFSLDEFCRRLDADGVRLKVNVAGLNRIMADCDAQIRGVFLALLRARLASLGGDAYMPVAVRVAGCPSCGAPAGRRCRSRGLRCLETAATRVEPGLPVQRVHVARIRAAHGEASR